MICRHKDEPEAYRARLLTVLVSQDIRTVMDRLGWSNKGDVLDNKYELLAHWNSEIEAEVIKLIKYRLRGQ